MLRIYTGEVDSNAYNLVQNGTVRLKMEFSTPITETPTALVYGEFDSPIEIDRDRNIIIDYGEPPSEETYFIS